jgi:phosphoglycerate dehydrogenase-like enzyme
MPVRCAILDDYQNVALTMADWGRVKADAEIKVFNEPFRSPEEAAKALAGFDIICAMRERTPFPRAMFEKLPGLKLLVTTGMRNAAIDMAAAKDHKVTVCGTESAGHPTAELTIGLMIDLAREISVENARMKGGEAWQATVGGDLNGKTLGIL